jgi:hypothetical protein
MVCDPRSALETTFGSRLGSGSCKAVKPGRTGPRLPGRRPLGSGLVGPSAHGGWYEQRHDRHQRWTNDPDPAHALDERHDPGLVSGHEHPAPQRPGPTVTQERLIALVSAFFGGLALLLAAVGLYGVVAHAVRARQKEIGLRIALGATPSSILRIVFESVGLLIAAGLALGAAGSLWAARFVEALLFQLAPRDPATFGGAAIVLVAVGVMAAWLPAYRAARLDPVAASEPSEPATSSAGTESRSRRGLAQVSRPSGRVRIATD